MTRETVLSVFAPAIIGEEIALGNGVTVAVDTFAALFADAEPTFASLSQADAGIRGYADFLERCKAQGILPV